MELHNTAETKGMEIEEVHLSHNQLDSLDFLDIFPNLKLLILDQNNIISMNYFQILRKLETLFLLYNGIRVIVYFLINVSQKLRQLKLFNLMKILIEPSFFRRRSTFLQIIHEDLDSMSSNIASSSAQSLSILSGFIYF